MSNRINIDDIRQAEKAIAGRVVRTPSVESPGMTRVLGAATALKIETQQIAGCFKPRGIVNKILSLSEPDLARGLVTVSGGNHGIATAELAPVMGTNATIVMPETAPQSSIARIRSAGADLILAPDSTAAFEIAGSERYRDRTYVHSYDDPGNHGWSRHAGSRAHYRHARSNRRSGEHRWWRAHLGGGHGRQIAQPRGAGLGGGNRRGGRHDPGPGGRPAG